MGGSVGILELLRSDVEGSWEMWGGLLAGFHWGDGSVLCCVMWLDVLCMAIRRSMDIQ